MSDILLPANGFAAGERLSAAHERSGGRGAAGLCRPVFGWMAIAVILMFWIAQFAYLTFNRWLNLPGDAFIRLGPRAIVTCCAILVSYAVFSILRAIRGRTLARRALTACGLALAGCAAHSMAKFIVFTLIWGAWGDGPAEILIEFANDMSRFFWYHLALTVMLLALTYGEDLAENEDRIASLQAQANVAQLNALRYQLNPHFLFNTLNSVASLISKKMGAEAEAMVVSLSDFLRSTLVMDPGREITLDEEIKLQSLYLDIEKIRFPRRLKVTIDVPDDLRTACVPNLITQPLIENAIKYGVAGSTEPVHLNVIARDRDGKLLLEVRDDGGNAATGASSGTRVGLRNVAERLRLGFGGEGSLTAGRRPEGGFSARILIPLRRA